ncbi:MAG: ribonuclease HII [Methanomassiliicoccales archaeon]
MLCGIDEAGRGPIIGPMVIAAVCVDNDLQLVRLNVNDSKKLSPSRRLKLAEAIRQISIVRIIIVNEDEIDSAVERHQLNGLEAAKFSELINELRPRNAFIDAADANPERFKHLICNNLACNTNLICEHKADERYPVVSAASIIAKAKRDELVKTIEMEIGEPIGSGYASDPATRTFLMKWVQEKKELPPHVRRSWITSKNILFQLRNSKIDMWADKP